MNNLGIAMGFPQRRA